MDIFNNIHFNFYFSNEILPIAEFENIPIDPLFTVGIHGTLYN